MAFDWLQCITWIHGTQMKRTIPFFSNVAALSTSHRFLVRILNTYCVDKL